MAARTLFTLLLSATLCLASACGGDEGNGGEEPTGGTPYAAGGPSGTTEPEGGGTGPEPSDPGCDETTALQVSFGADEKFPVASFEVTHTTGFIAGMRYNAKATAKLAYAIFANYEPRLDRNNLVVPTEEGQVALVVTFKTETVEMPFEEQMERYKEMAVPTGTFAPTWMGKDVGYQVVYYVGGQAGGQALSGQGASGEATLTVSTPDRVCGSIDFTSKNGTTVQGTFHVEIVGDKWAR
ncbi:MAG: hypothetical protein ACYTG6_03360 [Planctomycetota bacterium]|jgi:hypothetical protein